MKRDPLKNPKMGDVLRWAEDSAVGLVTCVYRRFDGVDVAIVAFADEPCPGHRIPPLSEWAEWVSGQPIVVLHTEDGSHLEEVTP